MSRYVKSKKNNIYVVENIVDVRMKRGEKEYLIKWEGYPDTENTWEPESNVQDEELISDFEAARYACSDTPGQKTLRNGSRTAKKRASENSSIGLRSKKSSKIRANSNSMATTLTPRRGRPRESIMETSPVSPEFDGLFLFRRKTNDSTATTIDGIDDDIDDGIDDDIDDGGDSTLEGGDVEFSGMGTAIEDVEESDMDEEVTDWMSEETSAAEHVLRIKFVLFKLVEYFVLFILFSFFLSSRH